MKKTVVLHAEYEMMIARFNSSPKTCMHGNRMRTIVTLPHSVFRFWGVQVISGELQKIEDKTEIKLTVRPSIVEIVLLTLLMCMSLASIILLFFEKCAPVFSLLLTLFTVLRISVKKWEVKECLDRFIKTLV